MQKNKKHGLLGFCRKNNLSILPETIVDKTGNLVDVSGLQWRVNETSKNLTIKWDLYPINNPILEYAFKRYILQLIKEGSPGTAHTTFHKTLVKFSKFRFWKGLNNLSSIKETKKFLPEALSKYLQSLRKVNQGHIFIYIRAWYKWCAEQSIPGFNLEQSYELLKIKLSGNAQGIAVLSEDIEEGPFTEQEIITLRNALVKDDGPVVERLCVWLALIYGCNSANFVLLKESDFIERKFESLDECFYELRIPRIKKRGQKHKRSEFKTRKVDNRLANLIKEQIETNKRSHPALKDRPLLMRKKPYQAWMKTELTDYAYHMSTGIFYQTLKQCIKRMNIISPRTGQKMHITARRFRYTYATSMVQQGASAAELAELLDHSDLQHVRVYYNARSTIVERLNIALAERLAPLINAFKGQIIPFEKQSANNSNRINYQENKSERKIQGIGTCGAKYLCNLYPPLSCYLCEKFQPWKSAPHGAVLEDLLNEREKRINEYGNNDHYANQLDDIIYSVAQVKILCEREEKSHE